MQREDEPKRRGRPPSTEAQRRKRRNTNDGSMNIRLGVPTGMVIDPEYVYHWINDEGSRINQALKADYDFADTHGNEVDQRSPDRISRHVGTQKSGQPLIAFIMRKHRDWHEEDVAREQGAIDDKMKDIKRTAEDDPAKPTGLDIKVE